LPDAPPVGAEQPCRGRIDRLVPDSQRLTRRHLIGLVIGFAGIMVLFWPEI